MAESAALDLLENICRAHIPDDWYVERSLTFSGITPDLLLVHPARGVIVVRVVELNPGFTFGQYAVKLRELEKASGGEKGQEAHADLPMDRSEWTGWEGIADPRDELVEWRATLEAYLKEMDERLRFDFLRAVLVVVSPSEPEKSGDVFSTIPKKERKGYTLDWLSNVPADPDSSESRELLERLVPQIHEVEVPMPDGAWGRIKREVLGIEDAVLGLAPMDGFAFDREQDKVLEYLASAGLKRFRGPAGAGKTMMIAKCVADCVKSGGRALVVVRNKTMCQMIVSRAMYFMNEGVHEASARSTNMKLFNASAFVTWQERWWQRVCVASNLERDRTRLYAAANVRTQEENDALESSIIRLVRLGLERGNNWKTAFIKYDLVVADEAQNMLVENWECLRMSVRDDSSRSVVCSDPTQSMYGDRAWTEQRMKGFSNNPWRTLKASHRLPDDYLTFIHDFVEKFPPDEEVILPEPTSAQSLFGSTLYRIEPTTEFQKDAIVDAVEFALNILGFQPHQVVFLTPINERGKLVVRELKSRGIPVTHTFNEVLRESFGTTDGVRGTTYHSYAGWESPCVIVDTGFVSIQMPNANGLLYSGLTRLAKRDAGSALIIVEADNKFRTFMKKYGERIDVA